MSAVAMTNPKGVYTIPAVVGNANLIFSLSDYSTQEIPTAKSNIDVALEFQESQKEFLADNVFSEGAFCQ